MKVRGKSVIATVLVGTQLACMGPLRAYDPHRDYPAHWPNQIQVTFTDGHQNVISSARVLGDTALAGWDDKEQHAVVYPLSSITSVKGRERSAGRSALLGVGILGVIIVGAIALSAGTSGESIQSPF